MSNPFRSASKLASTWLNRPDSTSSAGAPADVPQSGHGLVNSSGLQFEPNSPQRVLVIEDEPFIALDLVDVVESLGHNVIGVARTLADAVSICGENTPELIISDIQLADGSSGIDAVNVILQSHCVPVVFISAHLEELTAQNRPAPLISISKPFRAHVVRDAINQAIAFQLDARPAGVSAEQPSLEPLAQLLSDTEN